VRARQSFSRPKKKPGLKPGLWDAGGPGAVWGWGARWRRAGSEHETWQGGNGSEDFSGALKKSPKEKAPVAGEGGAGAFFDRRSIRNLERYRRFVTGLLQAGANRVERLACDTFAQGA